MTQTITMRDRCAAQSVIEELLGEHALTPPRSPLARFFGVSPLGAASVSRYLQARGEIAVAALLAELPAGWVVFHALPAGKRVSDIDHIVVGPGGVVAITTKHHPGQYIWVGGTTFMVSGHTEAHLHSALAAAERVTTLIRSRIPLLEPARSVIALVDPKQITIRDEPEHVAVLEARGLCRWLLDLPESLSDADAQQVAALLDDPALWGMADPVPPDELMRQFAVLDAEVQAARMRRGDWALITGALLAVAVCVAAPFLLGALMATL
jgi:hypothetical protein